MKWMLVALVAFIVPLLLLFTRRSWACGTSSIPMAIIMIVAGFLFVSVSAYLAGLVGSSNNPVSGITIATILFASVVLMVLLGERPHRGRRRRRAAWRVAAIMIGAVVCCAGGGRRRQTCRTSRPVTWSARPRGSSS